MGTQPGFHVKYGVPYSFDNSTNWRFANRFWHLHPRSPIYSGEIPLKMHGTSCSIAGKVSHAHDEVIYEFMRYWIESTIISELNSFIDQ